LWGWHIASIYIIINFMKVMIAKPQEAMIFNHHIIPSIEAIKIIFNGGFFQLPSSQL